jgi:hypothetical protein
MAICKNCGKNFKRRALNQLFCTSQKDGVGNCKTAYWIQHDKRKLKNKKEATNA